MQVQRRFPETFQQPVGEKKKNRSLGAFEWVRTLTSIMKIYNTLLRVCRLLFYVNFIVTTKQKPAVDSQKVKRISKYTTKKVINL